MRDIQAGRAIALVAIFSICSPLAAQTAAPAQQAPAAASRLEPITVTGKALGSALARNLHAVTSMTQADIQASSADNLAGLLAQVNGVNVRQRGALGVQADVSVRGSNFKETQILVNGVPVGNPQSGHLSMDLPIPLSAIRRIEIVKGAGAIQYGGTGTGGIINIVTRRADRAEGGVALTGGSYATREFRGYAGDGSKSHSNLLSVGLARADSENPQQPTDVDIRRLLYTGDAGISQARLQWGLGASRKEFGAWGFYSDTFPNERERTQSRLAWLILQAPWRQWQFRGQAYWSGHHDHFSTIIDSADFLNKHETDVRGANTSVHRYDPWGVFVGGVNYRHAHIDSNALGHHERDKLGLWLFRRQRLTENLRTEFGVNRVHYSPYGTWWLPSVALSWQFQRYWHGVISWARSARMPTYTELYLDTLANQGNPELGVERSSYAELGVHGSFARQSLNVALYSRETSDYIDFARKPGETAFHARNFGSFMDRGLEVSWRWHPDLRWLDELGLGYHHAHTHLDESAGKNGLHIPSDTWRVHLRVPITSQLHLAADARRPNFSDQPTVWLVGTRLQWQNGHFRVALRVKNLFDKRIIEAGFSPIPGRWFFLTLGLRY